MLGINGLVQVRDVLNETIKMHELNRELLETLTNGIPIKEKR